MIVKKDKQVKLEFGKGDISIGSGYSKEDKSSKDIMNSFVTFQNQEAREIGSPAIGTKGIVDLEDFPVVMTFTKKQSIDVLIRKLELAKMYLSHRKEED